MTVSAPHAIALAMSPEYCRPPSQMTGTPAGRQALAASKMALTCGTPTPATTRVVQMELCTTTLSAMKLWLSSSTSRS
jgi:hypothetical protein